MSSRVRQNQLLLPLLEVLAEHPGGLAAADAVDAVADRLNLSLDTRRARAPLPSGGDVDLFARDVRWARQRAKQADQIDGSVRNLWRLTPRGKNDLRNATPGLVITLFETANGRAIWAEAESAFGTIEDGSVNLWLTSPPYDLQRTKEYQKGDRYSGAEYLDWLTALCREMHRTLATDGSLILNLGDAFESGRPVMSLYQERLLLRLCDNLGFRLAQKLVWHNPAKMPAPAEWVTIRRCRVTPATENLYWLSKTDFPKANNANALRPYSASMLQRIAAGGEKAATRPSGHERRDGAFGIDNGGSIAHNLIAASHTSSNDAYIRFCKENSLPVHPARFPAAIAEFPIKLLTDPGDLVGDCFAGSCTTGAVAEGLGRRWLNIERSMTYLRGGISRFPQAVAHAA